MTGHELIDMLSAMDDDDLDREIVDDCECEITFLNIDVNDNYVMLCSPQTSLEN